MSIRLCCCNCGWWKIRAFQPRTEAWGECVRIVGPFYSMLTPHWWQAECWGPEGGRGPGAELPRPRIPTGGLAVQPDLEDLAGLSCDMEGEVENSKGCSRRHGSQSWDMGDRAYWFSKPCTNRVGGLASGGTGRLYSGRQGISAWRKPVAACVSYSQGIHSITVQTPWKLIGGSFQISDLEKFACLIE